jgi:2-phospho-L-lactate guanylyltransferase
VVLPVKPFHQAKSRLVSRHGTSRQVFAHAFFRDTLEAVLETIVVGRILVVTDDQQAASEAEFLGAVTVSDQPRSGLNAAVRRAARRAHALAGKAPIAVLTADLPALRSTELGHVLASAAEHDQAFLADHTGQGTTLLAAAHPQWLNPSFEGNSAHRHRLGGAYEITGLDVPSVRLDVDTHDDLRVARQLGVGRYTQDALALQTPRPTQERTTVHEPH